MKRFTWFILILFILALGVYFLVAYLPEPESTASTITPDLSDSLLPEEEGLLTTIRIFNTSGDVLALQRNTEGIWEIIFPERGEADQSKLSAVESQIYSLKVISSIGTVESLDDFGLLNPRARIKLEYSSGVSHEIKIGTLTPTKSGYYVQIDNGTVSVVAQYSLDAILELSISPPFPPTPTPSPTSEIPVFTVTIESTPLSTNTQVTTP